MSILSSRTGDDSDVSLLHFLNEFLVLPELVLPWHQSLWATSWYQSHSTKKMRWVFRGKISFSFHWATVQAISRPSLHLQIREVSQTWNPALWRGIESLGYTPLWHAGSLLNGLNECFPPLKSSDWYIFLSNNADPCLYDSPTTTHTRLASGPLWETVEESTSHTKGYTW